MDVVQTYLDPRMLGYFERKLPALPAGEVLVRVEETLRFLAIARFCRGAIPVTQEIDDVWHLWILQTREYADLCARLPGGRFLHHSSDAYARAGGEGLSTALEDDVATLGTYVANYGPFAPDRLRFWHLADRLVTGSGMSVAQLNTWLSPVDRARTPAVA